ncbi:MAG: hypothetical protein SGILL_009826, partial [Bacillariaceae sp.]
MRGNRCQAATRAWPSLFFLLLRRYACIAEENGTNAATISEAVIGIDTITTETRPSRVPDDCTLVMSQSSIQNGGWGVFSLIPRYKGDAIHSTSDPIIQIPDMTPDVGAKKLVWEYLWDGQETGGQFEGQKVFSFVPGIGMLVNGAATEHNVLPSMNASIDEANTQASPGTGAITHYHNYTWFVRRDIMAGNELFVNFGTEWFQERGFQLSLHHSQLDKPSLQELRQEGYCLDNLLPGMSAIPIAGRGAFSSRALREGSIVAPVPVLPVSLKSLTMYKQHRNGQWIESKQLLLNYCYGHANASFVLCPYSNMLNLVNHAPAADSKNVVTKKYRMANVRLQWSEESRAYFDNEPSDLQESSTQLLLELIALRDIVQGEEILLDYGDDWARAWHKHVEAWEEPDEDEFVIPSNVMNARKLPILRTVKEQQTNPYPENLFTTCYFNFDERMLQEVKTRDNAASDIFSPNSRTHRTLFIFHILIDKAIATAASVAQMR